MPWLNSLSKRRRAAALACCAAMIPVESRATLGIFEHGAGIRSMGWGGISYATGDETTTLPTNPATVTRLGNRFDIGVDGFVPIVDSRIEGNALGPDQRYPNDGRRTYAIPQGGWSHALGDRWSFGFSIVSAGLGPDYTKSPYARFGGANRANISLGSSGIATALGYRLTDDQSIGIGLDLGYQSLSVEGIQFASDLSETRRKVTNQGKDGEPNAGFSLGWRGRLLPSVTAGVGYRSKSWAPKHRDYRGLIPDGGSLELPAIWGAGIAWRPGPSLTLAFDYQRYENASERGFGSPISRLAEGHLLGSPDGPGFGFADMNAYKFGVQWQASPALALRAGYVRASEMMEPSETLLGILGAVPITTHYTVGTTWMYGHWEVSGSYAYAPEHEERGRGSIPPAFGGGEADVGLEMHTLGISFGRRFGH